MNKTLETLEAGDIITDGTYYRRILARLGGEGELTTYAVSEWTMYKNGDSDCLNKSGCVYTVYDLKRLSYTPYLTPEDKTEKLVEKYAMHFANTSEMKIWFLDFAKDLLGNK